MSDEARMTIDERRKHLRMMMKRYEVARKRERGRLLDEMEAVTGQHRKGLIRLMEVLAAVATTDGNTSGGKRRRELVRMGPGWA